MMSFWIVPVSLARGAPCSSATRDVERQQPGRRRVDRHRGVHLAERDAVEQRRACRRDARPARRPCRPRRGRARGRCRSRSGSADRRRSRGRSGPWRDWCGRARSTWPRSNGRRRCGTARACRARAIASRGLVAAVVRWPGVRSDVRPWHGSIMAATAPLRCNARDRQLAGRCERKAERQLRLHRRPARMAPAATARAGVTRPGDEADADDRCRRWTAMTVHISHGRASWR